MRAVRIRDSLPAVDWAHRSTVRSGNYGLATGSSAPARMPEFGVQAVEDTATGTKALRPSGRGISRR
jgi:hypothetical protein